MARCTLQIGAGARVKVLSSRSALIMRRGWLSKSVPASVMSTFVKGLTAVCPLFLSRKDHVCSTTNWTLHYSRERSEPVPGEALDLGERAPSRLAWRRVVSCRQPLPWQIPPTSPASSCNPRLLPKASILRGPSIASCCETRRHSTNDMAPFSSQSLEPSLPQPSSLSCCPDFGDPAGASSHGARGGRARALIGHGVQPQHTLFGHFG